jgi:ADP-ribosyl-[dinitrogen reductase] hydrolase
MTTNPDAIPARPVDPALRDRARGCAVGAAIGDALGMPLEFGPRRAVTDLVCEMTPGRLPAGSFTDDTEMALALAESLLAHRPLRPCDLAERFAAWFRAQPPDVGNQTAWVLARVAAGQPWEEVSEQLQHERPDAAGNGSLMRCWPLALAYWDNLDDLLIDSWQQSRVTHPNADCVAASTFISAALHYLINGRTTDAALLNASSLVRSGETFWRTLRRAAYRQRDALENSGWVQHTLESALWGLLNTDSFEEALIQVVNLGDDADTAGSVVGALAGARYGLGAIPKRWQAKLRGEWPLGSGRIWQVGDLIALADRLVDAS